MCVIFLLYNYRPPVLARNIQYTIYPIKMGNHMKLLICIRQRFHLLTTNRKPLLRLYHKVPFVEFYERITGNSVSQRSLEKMKKKHPNLDLVTDNRLKSTLHILDKFGITAVEACKECHLFSMNPITMDNYGEILKECGFIHILPIHIVRYHTLVKSHTIGQLKELGLLRHDLQLEDHLQNEFKDWPDSSKSVQNFNDKETSILKVRMSVLEKYLSWKIGISSDEFQKYCRNYLPLKHKPMSDIQEALHLAQNDIKLNIGAIRRNGFIISSDPVNTKLILENVKSLSGLDIREVIRIEPAILKNNYNALVKIKSLLMEYNITLEAQQNCLKVYCMRPDTVEARLQHLVNLKEYQVLSTNPRVLSMVVHKNKIMDRLLKIQEAKKQCFSLNHLVSSTKVFNSYINSFGNKVCSRDVAVLITSSLTSASEGGDKRINSEVVKEVVKRLKRHKYYLHAALHVIDENIRYLQKRFDNEEILDNCHLLLYPLNETKRYIEYLLRKCADNYNEKNIRAFHLDSNYNNLKFQVLSRTQILSLVLYEIEKKYHFSGDGIWSGQESIKV